MNKTFSLKTPLFILTIAFSLLIGSCKKNDNQLWNADAVVVNDNSTAANSCGWQLQIGTIGNDRYHADNLADTYKVTGTKVHITYHINSERFFCSSTTSAGLVSIHIESIVKISQ